MASEAFINQVHGLARRQGLYPQMVRITIAPEWARFFDFGAGRMPGFLEQLARAAQEGQE